MDKLNENKIIFYKGINRKIHCLRENYTSFFMFLKIFRFY